MMKALLLMCALALISCADGENDSDIGSDGGGQNNNKIYTLTWLPPSTFEDLSPLLPDNDLSEYRIYYGDSVENVLQNFMSVSIDKTSFSTQSLDANIIGSIATVYVGMTSVSNDGIESVLSEIVTFNP